MTASEPRPSTRQEGTESPPVKILFWLRACLLLSFSCVMLLSANELRGNIDLSSVGAPCAVLTHVLVEPQTGLIRCPFL